MYLFVKCSVFDAVLERIRVGLFGKFSFLEEFFRILQIPPPSKAEKTRQGGICSQSVGCFHKKSSF
eukprot:UN21475